mgnify:CR=1 FL=1
MEGLDSLTDIGGKMGFLLNTIKESGGIDVFHILVERTVQPVCTGRLIDPNVEVEKEKGTETEMQEAQDAVQDTLQNTARMLYRIHRRKPCINSWEMPHRK